MAQVLLPAAIGALGGLLFAPLSMILARRIGAMDHPGDLKVHSKAMPRFGGSAIWAATVLATVTGALVSHGAAHGAVLLTVPAGATPMALLSAFDDTIGLSPKVRIIVGAVITMGTALALAAGMGLAWWEQAGLACVLTLWVLGCANAVNMLDGLHGLDGLAAAVAAIAAVTLGAVAALAGSACGAVLLFGLAGASVAFLRYSFLPARTFMGDVGSHLLGFILACSVPLVRREVPAQHALPAVLGMIVALGVPVGDMLLAMGRRLVNRRPVFDGDRSHVYDQLRARHGYGVVKTVLIMYVLAAVSCLLGVGLAQLTWPQALTGTLIVMAAATLAAVRGGFVRVDATP
jgi:UDP-GlcNAc:undecaprenyl-phosphate/decaprenyl-phosphate GlcNAc-1-phosphate transferase